MTNQSAAPRIVIEDLWPDRASYSPGASAVLHATLRSEAAGQFHWEIHVSLLDQEISREQRSIGVAAGISEVQLPVSLPDHGFRGYGIDLRVLDAAGAVVAEASTALDVLDNWTQAPRYGFLSDFAPNDPSAASNVHTLARYHVNVVQFYDWMWRHYVLMPPTEVFTDGMGRELSLRTVREKVAACRAEGMAAMGYAAVYGAEPEYALAHPDEMLYDASGKPY
ncbi:MAG: glycoside hydrolase family 66 protein, partial [Chloroflexota bacterium]